MFSSIASCYHDTTLVATIHTNRLTERQSDVHTGRYLHICTGHILTNLWWTSAELWPLTGAQKKKLEAAHHKFQRRMIGISWKDKVSNERVRAQTQLEKIDLTIKERRLRWLGHVL